MCGILAAEYQTLPKPMRSEVIRFFDDNQEWLSHLLTEGQTDHTLNFTGPVQDVAQNILSTLEGAMLVARPYGDLQQIQRRGKPTTEQPHQHRPDQPQTPIDPIAPLTCDHPARRCRHSRGRGYLTVACCSARGCTSSERTRALYRCGRGGALTAESRFASNQKCADDRRRAAALSTRRTSSWSSIARPSNCQRSGSAPTRVLIGGC